MHSQRYTCPCCGYKTLEQCPPGTFEICPICYWEDDNVQFADPFFEGGANRPSLYAAQQNYLKFSASEALYIDSVRQPHANEHQDIHFKRILSPTNDH